MLLPLFLLLLLFKFQIYFLSNLFCIWRNEEFHPFLFKKYENAIYEEFESFDKVRQKRNLFSLSISNVYFQKKKNKGSGRIFLKNGRPEIGTKSCSTSIVSILCRPFPGFNSWLILLMVHAEPDYRLIEHSKIPCSIRFFQDSYKNHVFWNHEKTPWFW